jgi:hypothetical protein
LKITFGAYAQVYESTTNTTKSRSIGAVALKISNEQIGYYLMSLLTGRRLHCYQWTELPVPDYVIDRIEEMPVRKNQPVMANGHPILEWRHGVPVLDKDQVEGEDHEDDEMENGAMNGDDPEDEESDNEESEEESRHNDQSDHDAMNDVTDAPGDTYDGVNVDENTDGSEGNDSDYEQDGFPITSQ